MSLAAIHAHARGRPYRALVFCPGQLVHKWEREIRTTIPGVAVTQIESWKTLLHFDPSRPPAAAEWYVMVPDLAGRRWDR